MKILNGIRSLALLLLFGSSTITSAETVRQLETIKDGSGRLYVFYLGTTNSQISYIRQMTANGEWQARLSLPVEVEVRGDYPGPAPKISVIQISAGLTYEGCIVIYARDGLNNLYYSSQEKTNPDSWTNWQSMNGTYTQVLASRSTTQYQKIYCLTPKGSVLYRYLIISNKNMPGETRTWSQFVPLYGTNLKQIATAEVPIGRWDSERSYLFALSNDGSVYLVKSSKTNLLVWENWSSLGGVGLKKIDVVRTKDGRLALFAIGGDDDIYERHQLTLDGEWSDWSTMNGSRNFKALNVTTGVNGLIAVFGLHHDGSVDHFWQTDPSNFSWSAWSPLYGAAINTIECDHFADQRLIVVAIGGDGQIYSRQQSVAGGVWNDWVNLSAFIAENKAGLSVINSEISANNNADKIDVEQKLKKKKQPPLTDSIAPGPLNKIKPGNEQAGNNNIQLKLQEPVFGGPDSVEKKIASLEERILSLEQKTPYYGMAITEITANPGNMLKSSTYRNNPNPYFDLLKIDHPVCNNNPLASLFISHRNSNPVETIYYEDGYWYVRFSCLHVYNVENYRYIDRGWGSDEYQYTALKWDVNAQFYGGPASAARKFLKEGQKFELLIFSKSPTLKQEAGGRPIKYGN